MTNIQKNTEALNRATNSASVSNYAAIYDGFEAKGIPADDIKPRENVFTYDAWQALGRQVRRGEHGVRVNTFVPIRRKNAETGEYETVGSRQKVTTVFHITQTDPKGSVSAFVDSGASAIRKRAVAERNFQGLRGRML